jgi:hypothetical protein
MQLEEALKTETSKLELLIAESTKADSSETETILDELESTVDDSKAK